VVQFMWTEQGTMWWSLCGLNREHCGTVDVDPTENSVEQCVWTELGTVWYSLCGLKRERCGKVCVN